MQRINITTREPSPPRGLLLFADLNDDELGQVLRGLKALLSQQGVYHAEGFTAEGEELEELRSFIAASDQMMQESQ